MATNENTLRERKKAAKGRLTRARNQLKVSVNTQLYGQLMRKNVIRRAIKKVSSEYDIIEKIINALKDIYAVGTVSDDENVNVDMIIEALDKELEDIGSLVDESINLANGHIREREENGELVSDTLSSSSKSQSVREQRHSDVQEANKRYLQIQGEQRRQEDELERQYAELNERVVQFQQEQRQKEEELQKRAAELELTKRRAEEARKITELNQARTEEADQEPDSHRADLGNNFVNHDVPPPPPSWQPVRDPNSPFQFRPPRETTQRIATVKLKGVDLPNFSGENKTDYESWKAAFMSLVDKADIPVSEKMLRLQNSLSGKAQIMVKGLGYSLNAYERAKSKLEKKYGGDRRLMIKHLTALREFQKIKSRNLEDMENFLVILERVMIALRDSGPGKELTGQNLNLTAKEKLSQQDVQAYKYWLIEHYREDIFEDLVEWVELRVQIMEEALEDTSGLANKPDDKKEFRGSDRRRNRGFNNMHKPNSCIVSSCKGNHPPWVCSAFKALPVSKRRELISNSKRCLDV